MSDKEKITRQLGTVVGNRFNDLSRAQGSSQPWGERSQQPIGAKPITVNQDKPSKPTPKD